jgi:outer membrane usher protein
MDASVGINQSLSRSALFTTIVKRTIGSITEDSISFQLSWSFSPVKTLTSSYDSGTKTAESRYNTKIGDNTNEQVGVSTNPNEKQVDGQLNYIGNHGEVDVLGNSASTSGGTVNNNASINLKTAVVFAGDTWALSSPVYDSFVIVKPEGRLKDEDLVINNTVTPDFLGAMVLPNTVPYLENNININTNGLKEGLSLEHDSYTVVPTYKSGTVIKLNSESYVAIKGSLVYPNLKPYVLKSGKLTRKDNPTKFEYFFTNESGEFFIERLEAGDYILTLNDQEETKFIVNILKDSEGVLDYGELTVKDSKK